MVSLLSLDVDMLTLYFMLTHNDILTKDLGNSLRDSEEGHSVCLLILVSGFSNRTVFEGKYLTCAYYVLLLFLFI